MSPTPHIAIATCASMPRGEADEHALHAALERADCRVTHAVWSDPAVDWSAFDVCLIRTTWDYQERLPEFMAWIEVVSSATRLFNGADIVRWNTHKSYLRDLEARGVPVAPTIWLDRGQRVDLEPMLTERGWGRAFLKPAVGATARETLRFHAHGDDLARGQAHVDRLLPDEDLLLQPYLDRVETEGEMSAIYLGGTLTHAVRKIPVPGDYRVQDDFDATDERIELSEDERAVTDLAVGATPFGRDLLYGRVDFLRDEHGRPCVTELELVEPSFFFRHAPEAAEVLVGALLEHMTPAT